MGPQLSPDLSGVQRRQVFPTVSAGAISPLAPQASAQSILASTPFAAASSVANNLHQNYTLPMAHQAVFQPPPGGLTQAQQDQIKQQLAILQAQPGFGQNISPLSQAIAADTNSRPMQVLGVTAPQNLPSVFGTVGKGFWDQTVGSLVHQFQTDPVKGLESLGMGVGIAAGIAIANTNPITGAMADAALFAWGASQAVPQIVGAYHDEATHPSDQNLAKLLTSTAVGLVTMGTPFKAMAGVGRMAQLMRGQTLGIAEGASQAALLEKLFKGTITQDDITPYVISGRTAKMAPGLGLPEVLEKELLPQGPKLDQVKTDFRIRGTLDPKDPNYLSPEDLRQAEDYFAIDDEKERLAAALPKDWQRQLAEGTLPEDAQTKALRFSEIMRPGSDAQEAGAWQMQAQRFAHHFQYMTSEYNWAFTRPMSKGEEALLKKGGPIHNVDRLSKNLMGKVMGVTNALHSIMPTTPEQYLEMEGRAMTDLSSTATEMEGHLNDIVKKLGLKPKDLEQVRDALAEPHLVDGLSDSQKVFGRVFQTLAGQMTGARVQHGLVPLGDANWSMTHFRYHNAADIVRTKAASHVDQMMSENWANHATWDFQIDHDTGQIEMVRSKTPRQIREEHAADAKAWQESNQRRALLNKRGDEIRAARQKRGTLNRVLARAQQYRDNQRVEDFTPPAAVKDVPTLAGVMLPKGVRPRRQAIITTEVPKRTAQLDQVEQLLQPLRNVPRSNPDKAALLESRDVLQKEIMALAREARSLNTKLTGWSAAGERAYVTAKRSEMTVEKARAEYRAGAKARSLDAKAQAAEKSLKDFEATLDPEIEGLVKADKLRPGAGRPGDREMLEGQDLFRYQIRSFVMDMLKSSHREALMTRASAVVDDLLQKPGFEGVLKQHAGAVVGKIQEADKRPDVLPGDAFKDDAEPAQVGYTRVMGAFGTPRDLNYQPAIFMRSDLAKPYLEAMDKATTVNELHGAMKVAMGVGVSLPKRAIFYSPMIHFMNIAGRTIGQLVADPAGFGGSVGLLIKKYLNDPAMYSYMQTRYHMAGGVPAYRFQVGSHVNSLWEDQHGSNSRALSAIKTPFKTLYHPYEQVVEKGFWKMVDDLGLTAFMAEENRLTRMGIHPDIAAMAAAEYGNNIAGMVNPLYMNKQWSFMRNLTSFAPSYWGSFMRSVESAVLAPLGGITGEAADRLGINFGITRLAYHYMSKTPGISPVRLRTLDYRTWRELVRAQSSWTHSYMAAMFTLADGLNMIGSGHHMWQNDQGRYFDIDVSNFQDPGVTPSGETKKAYISGVPMFKQATDVANALGLGHDYGLGHLLNQQNFEQANATQKALEGAGSLWEGVRRVAAGKTSTAVQASIIAGLGLDPTQLLATGRKVNVPAWEALTSFVPTGYTARRIANDWQKAQSTNPDDPLAGFNWQDELQAEKDSFITQTTGAPQMFYMGPENTTNLDDQQIKQYQDARNKISAQAQAASAQAEAGTISPLDWFQKHENLINQSLGVDTATFGQNTPVGALAKKRMELQNNLALDDPKLTPDEYFNRLDLFETQWDQVLNAASPEIRALWWDHTTKQWTNMDYLYWYTRQIKKQLQAVIDHQGGGLVRQQEAAMYQKYGDILRIPGLNANDRQAIYDQYPMYANYAQLLKDMGQTPMGAMISAFTSPTSHTVVMRRGLPQNVFDLMQQLSPSTDVYVSQQALAGQEKQAQEAAGSPVTAELGGNIQQSPEFQQAVLGAAREAEAQVAANG